jgi:hypothetical protein
VTAAAAGRTWSDDVDASAPGQTVTVEVPPFWRAPRAPASGMSEPLVTSPEPLVTPPAPAEPAITAAPAAEPPAPRGRALRIAAVTAAGAGLGTAGVGLVFGLLARSSWDDSRGHCRDPGNVCDPTGVDLVHSAQTRATVSTVLVGVGAASAALGAVLWLTAPADVIVAPTVAPGGAALGVSGRF